MAASNRDKRSGGIQTVDFYPESTDSAAAHAVGVDNTDRVVAAGMVIRSGGAQYMAVARLKKNGSLDTSFNGNGKRITTFGWTNSTANALVIDNMDRVLVGGWMRPSAS